MIKYYYYLGDQHTRFIIRIHMYYTRNVDVFVCINRAQRYIVLSTAAAPAGCSFYRPTPPLWVFRVLHTLRRIRVVCHMHTYGAHAQTHTHTHTRTCALVYLVLFC